MSDGIKSKYLQTTSGGVIFLYRFDYIKRPHITDFMVYEGEEQIMKGTIKNNGCLDFELGRPDKNMHLCGPEQAQVVADLIAQCYELLDE